MIAVVVAIALWWLPRPYKVRAVLEVKHLHTAGDMIDVASSRLHVCDGWPPTTNKDAAAALFRYGFGASLLT